MLAMLFIAAMLGTLLNMLEPSMVILCRDLTAAIKRVGCVLFAAAALCILSGKFYHSAVVVGRVVLRASTRKFGG